MNNHNRGHFFAFGLLPFLNTAALLIYGLYLSTGGKGNTERALVIILIASFISLVSATISAFKRIRDLGYSSSTAAIAILVSTFLGPVFLVLLVYLTFAKTRETTLISKNSQPAGMWVRWLWVPVLLVAPWMALLVASAIP